MKKFLIPVFLACTIAMMFIMAGSGALLKTPAAPHGIINLELANTAAKTQAIINSWAPNANTDKIDAAKFNTYSDFLFLFFYAGLFYLTCKKLAAAVKGRLGIAGNILARAAIFAGIADIMENTGILFSLNNAISSVVSYFTASFSLIKWVIVCMVVLYIISSLLVLAYRKIKS